MKTTIKHTIEERYLMQLDVCDELITEIEDLEEDIAELEKIVDYQEDIMEREKMRERIDLFLEAKVCGPTMEICPYCGEELWLELGFWSYYEYLMWTLYYYPKMYGFDMGLSHYRRP